MNQDYICDLKCPQVVGLAPPAARCCRYCRVSRRYFLTPENSAYWTDEVGFLGDNGCRLSRDTMPPECKTYDCKNEVYYFCAIKYAPLVWDGDKWITLQAIQGQFIGEIDNIDELTETMNHFIKKYNKEFKSCESSDSTS